MWFVIAGSLLQLFGLAAAGFALYGTRREYAPEVRGIDDQIRVGLAGLKANAWAQWTAVRDFVSRPAPVVRRVSGSVALQVGVTATAKVQKRGFAANDVKGTAAAKIAALEVRTAELMNAINAGIERDELFSQRIDEVRRELEDDLGRARADADEAVRIYVRGGLRLGFAGLLTTALGTLLGLVGSLLT